MINDTTMQRLNEVHDAISLAAFIQELRKDLNADDDFKKVHSLDTYLEAMEAWLVDTKPTHPDVDSSVELPRDAWRMVSEVLFIGAIYD